MLNGRLHAKNSLAICSSSCLDMDWSVDRLYEFMLDWSILGFLAAGSGVAGSGVCEDGSAGVSSAGSCLFWEGLLAGHFSLWARSRGALALTTVLQLMHLALVLLSWSTIAKKFQTGSFGFIVNSSLVMVWSAVIEVMMTREFLSVINVTQG